MVKDMEAKNGMLLTEMIESLNISVVNRGANFETARVGIKDVNRPGLQLVGYFDYFDERREWFCHLHP